MSLYDAWATLRHGGNLLSPTALESLPAAAPAAYGLADRLRASLVEASDAGDGKALSELLDVVLEQVCGLRVGWKKGKSIGETETERLLDGTTLKPRRRLEGPDGEALLVFTTDATRIGVGKGRRPVAQVVEYLRRRRAPLALLTNGTQWRLVWADTDNQAWVEWEAERWVAGDQLADEVAVLRHVLSPAALTARDGQPCPLLLGIRDTRRGQSKLSKELGERVRKAVETLLMSRQQVIAPEWNQHARSNLYVGACHFVMRLVVILFAEARELLPAENPVYHQAYGLRGLLDQLDRLTPERRRARQTAWPRLLALFRLLHRGSPHPALTLPAYGGDLFRGGAADGDGLQRALALLESIGESPDDEVVYRMLVYLTRTTQRVRDGAAWKNVAAPVDFTELTSEYIGILYEGLLDYELHRVGEQPVVFLNLGDQPALPLDRLEAMDDSALAALVESAKVTKTQASEEDDEGDDEESDAEEPDDESESEQLAESPTADEAGPADDTHGAQRARALAWAKKAAEAGRLVKKPKGKSAEALAAYRVQLDNSAQQLLADVKLPGELYLVRWGGTRKGGGTFYTRPQLTLPTVRRTLEPLLRGDNGIRTPEELLSLKVCDPAMGSGSFLVAALRILTTAVVESMHVHSRLTIEAHRVVVACDLLPADDRGLPIEGFEERLEAMVRRAVVEHCLYGVDLDPLAVELARVALWVETLDRRLPFTFLDHKLRCGDSLIGTWFDRFRDYPLLAFDRESPDRKYKGVHFKADVWHEALKAKRTQAIREQADLLSGQLRFAPLTTSDEAVKAAVEKVRALYREIHLVPSGRPDERARLWREHIKSDTAMARVRDAFDTWCAIWFWPLAKLDSLPMPSTLDAPSEETLAVVREVSERRRFFHWELEFPDVFTQEGAGFDAVVGNPPWETLQPQSQEFFSNLDPLYRSYGRREAVDRRHEVFGQEPESELAWLNYTGAFKAVANFTKFAAHPFGNQTDDNDTAAIQLVPRKPGESTRLHAKWAAQRGGRGVFCDPEHPFVHQGEGKPYTYKLFVEQTHALLRRGGSLGLIVPSGLYTDKGTGALRTVLLKECNWRWLYGFENRNKVFDIHRSFKFCVVIAEKGGETRAIRSAFMRHDLEDWADAKGVLEYPAERVASFSPKSLSILEIRSERDLEVLTKIYANSVLLGDDGPDGWGIKYSQGDFNMTSDAKLFIAREKAEADGYKPDEYGRWVGPQDDLLLPLYEGRMIGQFDFSKKGWVSGKGRTAVWRDIPWDAKVIEPQYLMRQSDYREQRPEYSSRPRVVFMDVTAATNSRTTVATAIPSTPCGNSAAILFSSESVSSLAVILNSYSYDFIARARCGGLHLNYYVMDESPLPHRRIGRVLTSVALPLLLADSTSELAFEAASPALLPVARTFAERLRLRCVSDAIVAACYGLSLNELSWILRDCDHPKNIVSEAAFCRKLDPKGFWRIDQAEDPELRHTVLTIVAFSALERLIADHGGDRDAGIAAFLGLNDGEGWMLPETLRLADYGLGHDDRAQAAQPVASRLGPRFLDWQLAQTPEESWAECERHARAILGDVEFERRYARTGDAPASEPSDQGAQRKLFG